MAKINLGFMHQNGLAGLEKDMTKAFLLYKDGVSVWRKTDYSRACEGGREGEIGEICDSAIFGLVAKVSVLVHARKKK